MARSATIIGEAVDIWGDRWDVRERRPTRHGFAVELGWPVGELRGKGGAGGPRVIMTEPLQAHMQAHRHDPAALALPIGSTAIKRLRRLLGHHRQIDTAEWWEKRITDLSDLPIAEFAARHNVSVSVASLARSALFGPKLRPAGWWRAADIAEVLLSDLPRANIADQLGVSVGTVGRLRYLLRTGAVRAVASVSDAAAHDWQTDLRPIPELLPAWEAAHGWKGAEAARQLGAPYLTYRDWRGGRRKPSPEAMLRKLMTLIDRQG